MLETFALGVNVDGLRDLDRDYLIRPHDDVLAVHPVVCEQPERAEHEVRGDRRRRGRALRSVAVGVVATSESLIFKPSLP